MGNIFGTIKRLVNIHGVIDHVSVVEELDLGLEYVFIRVHPSLLQELQQGEDEVPVKVRSRERCQIVCRHRRRHRKREKQREMVARVRVLFCGVMNNNNLSNLPRSYLYFSLCPQIGMQFIYIYI